jgi:hypothetical protein
MFCEILFCVSPADGIRDYFRQFVPEEGSKQINGTPVALRGRRAVDEFPRAVFGFQVRRIQES